MCGRTFVVKGGGSLSSKEGRETGGMETALHPLRWRPNKDHSDIILSVILTSVIKIPSHVHKRPHSFAHFSYIGDVFQEFLPQVVLMPTFHRVICQASRLPENQGCTSSEKIESKGGPRIELTMDKFLNQKEHATSF